MELSSLKLKTLSDIAGKELTKPQKQTKNQLRRNFRSPVTFL